MYAGGIQYVHVCFRDNYSSGLCVCGGGGGGGGGESSTYNVSGSITLEGCVYVGNRVHPLKVHAYMLPGTTCMSQMTITSHAPTVIP